MTLSEMRQQTLSTLRDLCPNRHHSQIHGHYLFKEVGLFSTSGLLFSASALHASVSSQWSSQKDFFMKMIAYQGGASRRRGAIHHPCERKVNPQLPCEKDPERGHLQRCLLSSMQASSIVKSIVWWVTTTSSQRPTAPLLIMTNRTAKILCAARAVKETSLHPFRFLLGCSEMSR